MREPKARKVALTGMLLALALVLSYLESFLTPLLGLMPAMKLGLSNVVVMFALLMLGRSTALTLAVLKALFAFLTRGATAGLLSLCGGVCSWAVLATLLALPLPVTGYQFSVCGAIAHNIGQLAAACVVVGSAMALGYAPVLLVSSLATGFCTCLISKIIFPALQRIFSMKNVKKNPFIKKKS